MRPQFSSLILCGFGPHPSSPDCSRRTIWCFSLLMAWCLLCRLVSSTCIMLGPGPLCNNDNNSNRVFGNCKHVAVHQFTVRKVCCCHSQNSTISIYCGKSQILCLTSKQNTENKMLSWGARVSLHFWSIIRTDITAPTIWNVHQQIPLYICWSSVWCLSLNHGSYSEMARDNK